MGKYVRIKVKKGQSLKGKTDFERLKKMTEEEIEENAKNDPDAPLQTDEQLRKFKRVESEDE